MAAQLKDISGARFGALVALARLPKDEVTTKARVAKWVCLCDCGQTHEAFGHHLRSGVTTMCTECWRSRRPNRFESSTRLYGVWAGMRKRCSTPSVKQYENYGGKGVRVCAEWSDFQAFKKWALSHGYADDLTIDRVDSSGHYEPGNCRWLTRSENSTLANNERWAKHRDSAKAAT